ERPRGDPPAGDLRIVPRRLRRRERAAVGQPHGVSDVTGGALNRNRAPVEPDLSTAATASERLLYLDSKAVAEACRHVDVVAAVERAFALHAAGDTHLPYEANLGWSNGNGERLRSLNMPAYVADCRPVPGTNLINANPDNPRRGLPRASGVVLLFCAHTAQVTAILDAARISSLRTAAVST